jgi:hypothetical protein
MGQNKTAEKALRKRGETADFFLKKISAFSALSQRFLSVFVSWV